MLRSVLVAGATAAIQQARHGRGRPSPWLLALLARESPNSRRWRSPTKLPALPGSLS
jgi:hypothetical protein